MNWDSDHEESNQRNVLWRVRLIRQIGNIESLLSVAVAAVTSDEASDFALAHLPGWHIVCAERT